MVLIKLSECEICDGRFELPFYFDGRPFDSGEKNPVWGMTLLESGSMRFRWNENNPGRDKVLEKICKKGGSDYKSVAVEQDHTKLVCNFNQASDAEKIVADGILTSNSKLVPAVTIADCVPILFFDTETGAFGAVHSGWKGTGIAENWLKLAEEKYGTKAENVCAAIGAHIHSCCYVVNQERADFFKENFTPESIFPVKEGEPLCKGAASSWNNGSGPLFRLSLLEANLFLLKKAGIKSENIVVMDECTCCNSLFGSNRREMSEGNTFTVQAAFVRT